MSVPQLLCFGFLGHSGLLGKCSGNFSSNIVGDIRSAGGLLAGEWVDLFPVLGCSASPSHHCREDGGDIFAVPPCSTLVCGDCTGNPASSGALYQRKIHEVASQGYPGTKEEC